MPGVIPVTTPVPAPTVATPVLLLAHVPPPGVAVTAMADPVHSWVILLLIAGTAVTVMIVDEEQLPNE